MGKVTAMLERLESAKPPDGPALVEGSRVMTYPELRREVRRLSRVFGAHKDQAVGIALDQSMASVLLLLAVMECGIHVLPVDDMQKPSELDRIQSHCGVSVWIVPSGKTAEYRQCRSLETLYGYDRIFGMAAREPATLCEGQTASSFVYQLTSGTTGEPKIACLPMDVILREAQVYTDWFGFTRQDKLLSTVPLNHLYGLTGSLMAALRAGGALILCPRPSPRKAIRLLREFKATVVLGVPSFYQLLCDSRSLNPADCRSVRFAISAGARLPADVSNQFERRSGCRILQLYGSTETGAIAAHHPAREPARGSHGFILPGVAARIGEQGRLAVSSPSLFQGYLTADQRGNPTRSGDSLRDGNPAWDGDPVGDRWHLTDDLADIREGQIFLKGRWPRFINVAGRKVNPKEVEAACRQIPGVLDVIVFGQADPYHGETVAARMVLDPALSPEEVKACLRKHLADYKIPHRIQAVRQLDKGWKQAADRAICDEDKPD